MSDSRIDYRASGGASYVGPDAVNLFRAKTLASALRMYARNGMIPTRGVTATVMLKMAKDYTGKDYKRGQYIQAADDIKKWIDTMAVAIPTTVDGRAV